MADLSSIAGSGLSAIKQNFFQRVDADKSGTVSKQEFVLARPGDVSEDKASALYDKIDSKGTNALTENQLEDGLKANHPHKKHGSADSASNPLSNDLIGLLQQLLQQLDKGDQNSDDNNSAVSALGGGKPPSPADIFSKIDTNGNGSVTQAEFVAGRPANVSEAQATSFFKSIDTQGTGAISQTQFADNFKSGTGAPPPPPENTNSDSKNDLLATLLQAIKNYSSSHASGETAKQTNTILDV